MKEKILNFIIIIFVISVTFLSIHFSKSITPKEMRSIESFDFPETIIIENYTRLKGISFMTKVMIHKIFEIDSIKISFFYMYNEIIWSKSQLFGFIEKAPDSQEDGIHHYIIFLNRRLTYAQYEMVVAHELIHLDQMERGDLEKINTYLNIWKGKPIDLRMVSYYLRPYEIEAFKLELANRELSKKILFGK